MGKGKKKGQVQDDWENEMEEIAAEATGIDLTLSEVLILVALGGGNSGGTRPQTNR